MQKAYGWDEPPRYFQIEGARAQLEGVDMIIQAPTGFGKTAVAAGPHLWPESKGKITIVISPLMALEEEMVHTFKRDFRLEAIAVHNQNGGCSRATVKVLSMVVDEAHCISHWGADFRKKYGSLGIVRTFLPKDTAVIAMTATLTAHVRRDIQVTLQFSKGQSRFINVGNDRANVSMVVRACENPQNSYSDLDFVLPQNISSGADIPKTWIYVDNINTGSEIMDHLRTVLLARCPQIVEDDEYNNILRPFNAVMSLEYRRAAMQAFRDGKIRIMVCTDAAGMGCDIPDIEIVVQWMLPRTFSNWLQRAGRAARSRSRTGLAVLLVPRTVYAKIIDKSFSASAADVESKHTSHTTMKKKAQAGPTPKEYAIAHGAQRGGSKKLDGPPTARQPPLEEDAAADEGLTVFVQSTTCRREIAARAFDAPLDRSALRVPCCDICDPTLFEKTRPGPHESKRKGKTLQRGQAIQPVEQKLREWRRMVFRRDHEFAMYEPKSILDDSTITTLASHGEMTREKFTRLLSSSWLWWNDYGEELLHFMEGSIGDIPFVPIPSSNASKLIDTSSGEGPGEPVQHIIGTNSEDGTSANVCAVSSKRSVAALSDTSVSVGGEKRPRLQNELQPSTTGGRIFVNLSAESFAHRATAASETLNSSRTSAGTSNSIPYGSGSMPAPWVVSNDSGSCAGTPNLTTRTSNTFGMPQTWARTSQYQSPSQAGWSTAVYPATPQPDVWAAQNGPGSHATPSSGRLPASHYYPVASPSPLAVLTQHSSAAIGGQHPYTNQPNLYPTPVATPSRSVRQDGTPIHQTPTCPPSRSFQFYHYSPPS
ncbi:P-loop containing nucleoside triphosphate hydrolase protein [Panus rudis PR-1116 ss-1]|nr:P-loop containing nucleoside triphosphate hydrolase protein [Panus rudis PR-1116 ss-1]